MKRIAIISIAVVSGLLAFASYSILSDVPEFIAQDRDKISNSTQELKEVSGKWKLEDAKIIMLQEVVDSLRLTKENCFWADHFDQGATLKIKKDGSAAFSRFKKPVEATVKIENGNLVFVFSNGIHRVNGVTVEGTSSTAYDFKIEGRQLVISNQDQMVSEKYIFTK